MPSRLHLRSCEEASFTRRELHDGFSDADTAETIFLADEQVVERPSPWRFAIQPRVEDPHAEWEIRCAREGSYIARRPAVCRMPRAIVDTAGFLTCPDERRFLRDSVRGLGMMPSLGYTPLDDGTFVREVERIVERDERVVVLGAQTNANFSHWLLESVARALLFRALDDGTWLYLTPRLRAWQRQPLELIGIDSDRVLEVRSGGLIRFREVAAVSRGLTTIRQFVPAALAALSELGRQTLESGGPLQLERNEGRRCLYISRALTNVRRVSNEDGLAALFERHGFEVVCPETLPFREQVALFASADVVAGPNGSGMVGVTFSPAGTLVIELQREQQRTGAIDHMWHLCALREHKFVQVVCPQANGQDSLPIARRDMTVDLDHLDRLLPSLLDARRSPGDDLAGNEMFTDTVMAFPSTSEK